MFWLKTGSKIFFARSHSGNFIVKDELPSYRPVTEKIDEILKLEEQDQHASYLEIAKTFNFNHAIIWNHLKRARIQKSAMFRCHVNQHWSNITHWITIMKTLLKHNEIEPFLNQIITNSNKWIHYNHLPPNWSRSKNNDPQKWPKAQSDEK
jgi:hypothetical protein